MLAAKPIWARAAVFRVTSKYKLRVQARAWALCYGDCFTRLEYVFRILVSLVVFAVINGKLARGCEACVTY